MTNTLALLQSEKKYIFFLGDYNVDISPGAKHNLACEEFRNILLSEHFSLLLISPLAGANKLKLDNRLTRCVVYPLP